MLFHARAAPMLRPFFTHAALWCGLKKSLSERHSHIMAWVRHGVREPHCVYQMGKTKSKPFGLWARHDSGTAWARERIKTHILCSIKFSFEHLTFCEITWKNIVQPNRPQIIMCRMRIYCWIPKAKNTLLICNTYCLSTTTLVTRTRLNFTLC
jgi:hypothetical protein